MNAANESILVNEAVKMRRSLTKSRYGISELMLIYLDTPVSDYFKQDASLGGYVPHKRRLRKKNYFI
jgi:hypothetical protein